MTVPSTEGHSEAWKCPHCGQMNSDWAQECGRCETRPPISARVGDDSVTVIETTSTGWKTVEKTYDFDELRELFEPGNLTRTLLDEVVRLRERIRSSGGASEQPPCPHCKSPPGWHAFTCPEMAKPPHVRGMGRSPEPSVTLPADRIPDVLFDGYTVLHALSENAKRRTSAENVSDVLDAVVGILRMQVPSPEPGTKHNQETCLHVWKVEGIRNPSPDQKCDRGCGYTWAQRCADENACTVPPVGWRCTREAGHEGPCAAVPDAESICKALLQRAADTRAVPVLRAMQAEILRLQEQLTQGCCRYSPNWAERMMEPDPLGRYIEVLTPAGSSVTKVDQHG